MHIIHSPYYGTRAFRAVAALKRYKRLGILGDYYSYRVNRRWLLNGRDAHWSSNCYGESS